MFCFLCFTSAVSNKLYYTGDEPNVVTYHMCVVGNPFVFNKNTSLLFLCESRQSTREHCVIFMILLFARRALSRLQMSEMYRTSAIFSRFSVSTKRATFFFPARLCSPKKRKIAFEGKEHFSVDSEGLGKFKSPLSTGEGREGGG